MHSPFPLLLTARLKLRQILPADVDALYLIHSNQNWMRWYGVEPLTERSEATRLAEMFAGWHAAGSGFRWGLELRENGRLIGTCGLFRWNRSWCNCVIGYEIAPECSGKGLMLEAAEAILDYGFNDMGLHRVQAETHPDNLASIRLATKLGFRFEGVHREQACWEGRFHDLNCYSLLQNEWHARNTP